MEKIVRVEEATFKFSDDDWQTYEGFQIITDKQTIKLGIGNKQFCCEDWGYFITNDDATEFEGAQLLSVDLVDMCLNKSKAPELYEGGVMYVNLETSEGTLQFTAYNEHNGYYGHNTVVVSQQLNHIEYL